MLRFNLRQLTLLIGLITFHLRAARRAFAVTRWGNRTGLPHPRAVMASMYREQDSIVAILPGWRLYR